MIITQNCPEILFLCPPEGLVALKNSSHTDAEAVDIVYPPLPGYLTHSLSSPPLVKDLRFLIQVEAIAWQNNSMGREKPQRPLAVLF